MSKMSADDFFSQEKQSSPTTRTKKMSADDFFSTTAKEFEDIENKRISDGSKEILSNTLNSVIKPKTAKVDATQKKTVNFKQDQANKQAAASAPVDPFAGKTLTPVTGNLNNSIKSTLQGKVPAASLLQQTGGGPANASQIPDISRYNTTKKAIDETNIPEALKLPSRAINNIMNNNPLGIALGNAFQGHSGVTSRDTTGNKTVDKVTDVINNLVTPFITPTGAPLGQGIIGSTYDATGRALSGKVGQKILSGAEKVIPGSQNVARVAATEGIAGGLQGAEFGLQQGQDSGSEIARNTLWGAAAGGVLGGAGAAIGEALPKLFKRGPKGTPVEVTPDEAVRFAEFEGTPTANEAPVPAITREQEIYRKYLNDQPITQEEMDFMVGPDWNEANLNVKTPEASVQTSITPKTTEPVAPNKAEVAATTEVAPVNRVAKNGEIASIKTQATEVKPKKYESKTEGIRANYKTMTDSENISSKLKGEIGKVDQTYEIKKNVDTVAKANENVKNLSKSENDFLMNESGGAEHIATGYRVMQELDKAGEHARALSIADKLAKDLTKAGQTAQAASLISRLSPEGQLLNLIRVAEKNGKVVDVADSAKFKELATKVQENTGAGVKENAINDILNRLEKGETVTADDIKTLGDYIKSAEQKIQPKMKEVKDNLPKEFNDVRKRDKVVSFLESQEAAAQARINKRKGRLNSLPVEEWIDYSILIAAKVGKGVIKAETYVEDLVKLFGEDIKPIAKQVFEKAQELVNSVSKGSIEGDFLKANKAFKRITGTEGLSQQERIVEKYVLANPKVAPKDIDSLRKLAKSLTDLQGTDKIKADMEMQKILNSYEKSSVNDKINAIRYMSMLFNDATQSINAISGPMMATMGTTFDVLGSMVDIAMNGVLKTERTTTLYGTNPLRFIADYFKYAKIGGKAGWEGVNPSGIQGTNEIRGLAFKSKKNPLGIVERSLGAVAKGADYATYKTVYESELRKQGYLDALKNGVKRSDKDGLKSHIRKFMNDPPIEAAEQADRIGKNTTFQRSDTTAGKVANWLNAAPKGVKPAVNAVIPFVRTPLNIASQAATLTPFGILKGMFQLSSLSKASQREALRTLSMGITGGVGMTSLGYYLSSLGIITGANDTGNKDVNNINEQAGRGKYRFNTSALKRYMDALIGGEGAEAAEKAAKYQKGDMAFDYNKLQPLALPLAAGAAFNEKKGGIGTKLSGSASDSFGSLFGMSSLKGIQDTFQPQYTGTEGDKNINIVNRVIESYFKSFSPSILAQEARRQDPVSRKTTYNEGLKKDLSTYFMSRTPGLSKKLPENKDSLGNTKMNPEGFVGQHLNPYKSQTANYTAAAGLIADVIERTGDKTIAPKAPAKDFSGYDADGEKVTITLPTKRYEQLQEDTGAEITKRIMEIESNNDDEIIEAIKEIYSEVKAEQRDKLREEYELYSK